MIFTLHLLRTGTTSTTSTTPSMTGVAKNAGKKITKIFRRPAASTRAITHAVPGEFKSGIPARWWAEILTGLSATE